ncbi:MAG: molybdopterin oxidoreductase, partial [Mesorhizobium sp.]
MAKFQINRRKFLTSASLGLSGIALSGCDAFDSGLGVGGGLRSFLENANGLTYRAQRLLAGRDALAQEFTEADIRQPQRPNGVTAPDDDTYKGLLANNFADWRLEVSGLVEKPLALTREQLQNMPSRT